MNGVPTRPGDVFGPYTVVRQSGTKRRPYGQESKVYRVRCRCNLEYDKDIQTLCYARKSNMPGCRGCYDRKAAARTAAIVAAVLKHQNCREPARQFKISHQRVTQIMNAAGYHLYWMKDPVPDPGPEEGTCPTNP